MGIERRQNIPAARKNLVDFKKKQSAGTEKDADQSKVALLLSQAASARALIANARQDSIVLKQDSAALAKTNEVGAAKEYQGGPKLKAPEPKLNASTDEGDLNRTLDLLAVAKAELAAKLDAAVTGESDENVDEVREEYGLVKDAEKGSFDSIKMDGVKDPELLKKILVKQLEVNELTLDKTIPGRKGLLAVAKNELQALKSEYFGGG